MSVFMSQPSQSDNIKTNLKYMTQEKTIHDFCHLYFWTVSSF